MAAGEATIRPDKPGMLLITGWAHGPEAVQPLADAFAAEYDVRIMTGTEVLTARSIPDADCIVTGSMGGLLTLELLPASCRKLVLISSTARFCADEGYRCGTAEKVLRRMILQFKRNPQAVLEEFFNNVHYPHATSFSPVIEQDAPSTLDKLAAGLEYLLESDVRDRVPSIDIPVLLMHGAEDRIIPCSASEWLHDHFPDSRLQIYDQHGHALLAHQFDTCIGAMRKFLSK